MTQLFLQVDNWYHMAMILLSTLMQEPNEGLYISDISCIEEPTTCRDNAIGPFLSQSYTSTIIQSWSPVSELLAVYNDHNLWIINIELKMNINNGQPGIR